MAASGAVAFAPTATMADHEAISRSIALAAAVDRKNTLAGAAARLKILVGTSVDAEVISADPAYANLIARECSLVVPENALKPAGTRPGPDRFDFARADRLLAFAQARTLAYRGHTLVWYSSVPKWVESTIDGRTAALAELMLEVTEPCRHFRGRVDSWDVVNEVVDANAPLGLRSSYWLRTIGPDYIPLAFSAARAADPGAMLVLNENHIECDLPEEARKRDALLDLLRRLRHSNVPIDALGIEAHLGDPTRKPFDGAVFGAFLDEVHRLGLKILITELDVSDQFAPENVADRDAAVAKVYGNFLGVVLRHPGVVTVGFWGMSDSHTWLAKFYPRADGLPVRPTPFDALLAPKASYAAIVAAFENPTDV